MGACGVDVGFLDVDDVGRTGAMVTTLKESKYGSTAE